MALKIYKGISLLPVEGLYFQGSVYLPAGALGSFVGLWNGNTVFLHSPLAGKRICTTVLSPDTYADSLPPALEHFLALCTAAGAEIIYHDGGIFPPSDLVLVVEPCETYTSVCYLGAAFRSKPLAQRIAASLKRGLKLAYLPDPVAFSKPRYNLKLSLGTRLFTPAVAVQWPHHLEDLGPWLFTSLMEYFAGAAGMEASPFALPILAAPEQEIAGPVTPPQPREDKIPESAPKLQTQKEKTTGKELMPGKPASMSRVLYPDFFALWSKPQKIKKEPFT